MNSHGNNKAAQVLKKLRFGTHYVSEENGKRNPHKKVHEEKHLERVELNIELKHSNPTIRILNYQRSKRTIIVTNKALQDYLKFDFTR